MTEKTDDVKPEENGAEKKDDRVMDTVRESAHRIWLAGLGALAAAEEEGNKVFRGLVERGEKFEERRRQDFDKVKDQFSDARKKATGVWTKTETRV